MCVLSRLCLVVLFCLCSLFYYSVSFCVLFCWLWRCIFVVFVFALAGVVWLCFVSLRYSVSVFVVSFCMVVLFVVFVCRVCVVWLLWCWCCVVVWCDPFVLVCSVLCCLLVGLLHVVFVLHWCIMCCL